MSENFLGVFFLLDIVAFLAAVFMHLAKRSRSLVRLYALQSLAVSMTFFLLGFLGGDRSLMVVASIIFFVKVIIAPAFFGKIIRKLTLQRIHETNIAVPSDPKIAALKIDGKTSGFLHLFASHPPLEERIQALQIASIL